MEPDILKAIDAKLGRILELLESQQTAYGVWSEEKDGFLRETNGHLFCGTYADMMTWIEDEARLSRSAGFKFGAKYEVRPVPGEPENTNR